jgi:hypothetical protein
MIIRPASYHDQAIPAYVGNPWIEALPPLWTEPQLFELLGRRPALPTEAELALPDEIRRHLVLQLAHAFLEPLEEHIRLGERLDLLLRAGYAARNPARAGAFMRDIVSRADAAVQAMRVVPKLRLGVSAAGLAVIGPSGIGKTSALEAILSCYPQVITHTNYRDLPYICQQVVHLRLECPYDGSIRALCISFFEALDTMLGTHYTAHFAGRRETVDTMVQAMSRLASLHGLGLLIIDEIQYLSEKRNGGDQRVLNFFTHLMNEMGLPIVLVGTYKAIPVLSGQFRQARRSAGLGDFVWGRMKAPPSYPGVDGKARPAAPDDANAFQQFVESLWRYQYTRLPVQLSDNVLNRLYRETQGITALVVQLFMVTQLRVIGGQEKLTVGALRDTAAEEFRLLRRFLDNLRLGIDYRTMPEMDDLVSNLSLESLTPAAPPPVERPPLGPKSADKLSASNPSSATGESSSRHNSPVKCDQSRNEATSETPAAAKVDDVNRHPCQDAFEHLRDSGILLDYLANGTETSRPSTNVLDIRGESAV